MSEFSVAYGSTKRPSMHVGLGSAALVAAVALPKLGVSNFPKGVIVSKKNRTKKKEFLNKIIQLEVF